VKGHTASMKAIVISKSLYHVRDFKGTRRPYCKAGLLSWGQLRQNLVYMRAKEIHYPKWRMHVCV